VKINEPTENWCRTTAHRRHRVSSGGGRVRPSQTGFVL